MPDYDFSTVNASDFEKLACDLLNRQYYQTDIYFKTFKDGKDQGIDMLHSSISNVFEIVVQAKHYVNSSYSTLKSKLLLEKNKMDLINPARYILVTSQALSLKNKSEIQDIFSPHIKSINDIYGKDDLNLLLREYSDIEENHFKLWFSSTIALKNIMEYKYKGRSDEYQEHTLKKKLRLFVKTNQVEQAEKILFKNKFLIITGDPGIGKTTLSDILIYKSISKGFKLGIILDSIHELEEMIRDDDSKQIFYYDDFLGHTYAEIQKSKEAELFLLRQISRIENAQNKLLILNTRKFILTTFILESERFKRFNPLRAESKLELEVYTYGAKRRMLDNHILESQLNEDLKSILKRYAYVICSHKNFSPRLIDYFCSNQYTGKFSTKEMEMFIQSNLSNPKDLWEHAYWQQISDYERLLLNTLFSLRSSAQQSKLEIAFNNRIDFEVENNNFIRPLNAFTDSLKRLNGSFIDIYPTGETNRITFTNPSLEDYLNNIIIDNQKEVERILFSTRSFEPWLTIYKPYNSNRDSISIQLIKFLKNNYQTFDQNSWDPTFNYQIAIYLYYFEPKSDNSCFEVLNKVYRWDFIIDSHLPFHFEFLSSISSISKFRELISRFPISFFVNTLLSIKSIFEIENVILLLRRFGFNLIEILQSIDLSTVEKVKQLKIHFEVLFEDEIEYQYQLLTRNSEIDAHIDILDMLKLSHELICKYIDPNFNIEYSHLQNRDWNEIAFDNQVNTKVFGEPLTPEEFDQMQTEYIYDEYDSEYDQNRDMHELQIYNVTTALEDTDDLPF